MSNRHELGNMIFNLEDKKNLKEVKFTKDAVREVLGYLKELYEIKDKEHEEDRRVADLEAKLKESEYKVQTLLKSKDVLAVTDISKMSVDNFNLRKENDQLKQQLAEKEKEVAKWKNKKVKHLVDGLLVDRNLAIQIVEEIREDFRQKSFCNDYHEYIVDMEIFEYFNNKIKSLKGEK